MKVRSVKKRWPLLARAASAVLVAAGLFAGSAQAAPAPAPIFDWSVNDNSGNPAFTPAPILTNQNAAAVAAILAGRPTGSPLAVKIVGPISNATAAAIFNNYKVSYVFADFEGGNPLSSLSTLENQIRGGSSISKSAFVGEFNLYKTTNDATRGTGSNSAASFQTTFNDPTYHNSGATMSNEAAYPGSPDFTNTGGPNLRSAFFILPIDRVTFVTDFMKLSTYPPATPSTITPTGYQNIPWIARFNNWGNNSLNNDPGVQGYKYAFNTAIGGNNNQLLSRGDFSAQVLQYRLRGATSFNLFNYSDPSAGGPTNLTASSVIGYSVSQEQSDAVKGWTANTGSSNALTSIWNRNNFSLANVINKVPDSPGHLVSSLASGMMLSGVYDISGGTRQLALLLSNLSGTANKVDFWQKYGGASVDLNGSTAALDQMYTIQPGTHQLLQFNLIGGKWVLFANDNVFADSNRNGIGVPEPASLSLLGLAGAGLLLRRRSRSAR